RFAKGNNGQASRSPVVATSRLLFRAASVSWASGQLTGLACLQDRFTLPHLVETVKTEDTAAPPADKARNSATLAGNALLDAFNAVSDGMAAALDTEIAAAHFVSHSGSCTRAQVGIKHKIAWIGGDAQHAVYQSFRLRRVKDRPRWEQLKE